MNAQYETPHRGYLPRGKGRMTAKSTVPIVGLTRRAALRRAAVRLRAATSVLITTHLGPHPDGLGSALALASALARVDARAGAPGVLCCLLIDALGDGVPAQEASWLYLVIVTHTASFGLSKTNAEAHRIIADLADRGAGERLLYAGIDENTSVAQNRL